jgi:hypothetical protein
MNLAKAEKEVNATMSGSYFDAPAGHPMDYFVPNFGVDSDIKKTANSLKAAESEVGHTFQASFAQPAGHPVDYFVPNFGVDSDIVTTNKNIATTEKLLKHNMQASFDPPAPIPDNRMPDFGMDHDIK